MNKLHRAVKASEMADGDLMQVGVSTGFVLIADATVTSDGRIAVTIYASGDVPQQHPAFSFAPDDEVRLSTFADQKPV